MLICGVLTQVLLFQVHKEYTFLDYIMGGCQIHFTVSQCGFIFSGLKISQP